MPAKEKPSWVRRRDAVNRVLLTAIGIFILWTSFEMTVIVRVLLAIALIAAGAACATASAVQR